MKFQPKTEAERKAAEAEQKNGPLLPDGKYEAVVKVARDGQSKAGNDMITVGLDVYGKGGEVTQVWDYLLEAMHHKLYHFCEAAGQVDQYERGELNASDLVGESVMAEIRTEPAKGEYAARNKVKDYFPLSSGTAAKPQAAASKGEGYEPIAADDIPF